MILQVLSIFGALGILSAFAALQFDWLDASTLTYQILNLIGAGLLGLVAVVENQYGFILLEGAWVLISLGGIYRIVRERRIKSSAQSKEANF